MTSLLERLPLNSEGGAATNPSFEGTLVENKGTISFLGMRSDCEDISICLDFANKSETKKLNPDFYWVPENIGNKVILRIEPKIRTVELKFYIPVTGKKPLNKTVIIEKQTSRT